MENLFSYSTNIIEDLIMWDIVLDARDILWNSIDVFTAFVECAVFWRMETHTDTYTQETSKHTVSPM